MLEWKFRLVILLSVAAAIAAVLGNFGWLHNFGW
jgi:hypothetical protein